MEAYQASDLAPLGSLACAGSAANQAAPSWGWLDARRPSAAGTFAAGFASSAADIGASVGQREGRRGGPLITYWFQAAAAF